jgi:hypothetical protein
MWTSRATSREPICRLPRSRSVDQAPERARSVDSTGDPEPAPEEVPAHGFAATAREAWHDERIEIVSAILLALATVLSAWGAYQATRWSGEQANSYAESSSYRADSNRHGTVASRQIQIDVETFIAWADAKAQHDDALAEFYVARFRPEFLPAFDHWRLGLDKDAAGLPSGTPFEEASYVVAEQVTSNELYAKADAALAKAQLDNQISDNFVLTAVLFASVLFFAGMAARFRPQWIRWTMLGVAMVVFGLGLVVEFLLPQNVGF